MAIFTRWTIVNGKYRFSQNLRFDQISSEIFVLNLKMVVFVSWTRSHDIMKSFEPGNFGGIRYRIDGLNSKLEIYTNFEEDCYL